MNLAIPRGKVVSEVQALRMELGRHQQMLKELNGLTCALLREKHGGRAFISQGIAAETFGWIIHAQPLHSLGSYRLQAIQPDGTPYLTGDAVDPTQKPAEPALAADIAEAIVDPFELPEPESTPCAGPWHSADDAVGLLCPECGSRARVVKADASEQA